MVKVNADIKAPVEDIPRVKPMGFYAGTDFPRYSSREVDAQICKRDEEWMEYHNREQAELIGKLGEKEEQLYKAREHLMNACEDLQDARVMIRWLSHLTIVAFGVAFFFIGWYCYA